jgi:uncharacterized protein (DUF427 family)
MTNKPIKVPGPDHPITVEPHPDRVTATVAGRTIADSTATLALKEAGYPAVYYFPRSDVDLTSLEPTDHASYCPYKGDAGYFSIRTADGLLDNAVWTYQQPYDAVGEIKEYVAFYADRVEVASDPTSR